MREQGAGGDRHEYASRTRFTPERLAERFERGELAGAGERSAKERAGGTYGGLRHEDEEDVALGAVARSEAISCMSSVTVKPRRLTYQIDPSQRAAQELCMDSPRGSD